MRASSTYLDGILGKDLSVLDKGFIRVIDYMGDDSAIVQAARVSYGDGTKTLNDDRGLIRTLMRNWHTSPFEMCELKLHIKLPVFIARQWLRHRTASLNEISGRYSIIKDEFYFPKQALICTQSQTNKQGSAEPLLEDISLDWRDQLEDHCYESYQFYQKSLDKSISREISRISLPLNTYTEMYWKIDLHNLLHFIRLREDQHAQQEIRLYAETIMEIIENWVPITYEAFVDYRQKSFTLSNKAIEVVQKLIKNEPVVQKDSGLSNREWTELIKKLQVS
jgi:thymidylate synthase (FAD)